MIALDCDNVEFLFLHYYFLQFFPSEMASYSEHLYRLFNSSAD